MEFDVIARNLETSNAQNIIEKVFSNIAFVDLIVCFILTVPIFLAYIITLIVYFKRIDKSVNKKTHGLSRFALAGVLIIFGMIIVDMNVEFISAMLISLNTYGKLNFDELKPLLDSVIFINFIDKYRNIPFDILVMGNIFCTALYAGAEGLISSFKTLKVPVGMCIELPAIKRKRIKFIFLIWCAIAILSSIYTIIIGSEEIIFEVALCYSGVISTLIILILADRSPSVLQNFTSDKSKTEDVNISNPPEGETTKECECECSVGSEDAIDHITDAAVKVLKKLNPAFDNNVEQTSGGSDL